jgi:hypothetical protein
MLLKIPGINSKNVHRVMTKVENLATFCQMSEVEMSEVLENSKAAKEVFEFVKKSVKESEEDEEYMEKALASMAGSSKKTPMPTGAAASSSSSGTSVGGGGKFLKTKSKSSTNFKQTGSFSAPMGNMK